jgi:hypothetical protein
MSKPNRRRYRLAEVVTEIREAKPTIEIETEDGEVYSVPPPELWPDEAIELSATDPLGAARALLGSERYAAFTKSGGSASLLFAVIGKEAGVPLGESSAS